MKGRPAGVTTRSSGALRAGRKTITVQTLSSDGMVDTDSLKLKCHPAP